MKCRPLVALLGLVVIYGIPPADAPASAANVAIQDLCPGRVGEHFQALFDAVYYAVIVDALANPGPADPRRVDRAMCLEGAMPGVDLAQAEMTTVQYHQDFYVKVGERHTAAEPALAAYAHS